MCTNPVQRTITYKGNFSKKTVTVPCGKCAECRAKRQSEFAALSVLEAENGGSIGFITLTYNNDCLPFWLTSWREFERDGKVLTELFCCGVERGAVCNLGPNDKDFHCRPINKGTFFLCPSLNRQDVQKLIKRYRQDFFRRKGERLDFRFAFFGEYGERYKRPHYHLIAYGLEKSECQRFCSLWRYGFSDLKFVEHFNSDGSDAFSKVSRYVSKYVGKGDFLPDFVRNGYAEKPRRQSSIRFGQRGLDVETLRNFT